MTLENPNLPFFSYGLFQPGQPGFSRIRDLVLTAEPGWSTRGKLLERDGLPLLDQGDEPVRGHLIRFVGDKSAEVYSIINSIEPDKLYRWGTARVIKKDRDETANVLFGRKPLKGSFPAEYKIWDGQKEPLFTKALEVIRKTLDDYKGFEWDLEPFFHLQMAYLLLWCSIERFVSFKYHLGKNANEKVGKLAEDPAFVSALQDRVKAGTRREVFRSDDPGEKETLDPSNPSKALAYYYQIRSNITHRGKTAIRDHEMLRESLAELLDIFQRVLEAEFSEPVATARSINPGRATESES
jgi:hypothetical protein